MLRLNVLTLNCWGVPWSQDREIRMHAIGVEVARMGVDLVGFQELYFEADRQKILDLISKDGLIYHHYYHSGLLGSGLLIISRFPILETRFWGYSLNGRPQDLVRPDFYAGKGLAFAQLKTPAGRVDFYNTHLIAPYLEIGEDVYFSHRVAQAVDLANILTSTSRGLPLILTGDFNTTPDRLTYRTCVKLGEIQDSYLESNGTDPGVTVTTEIPYLLVHEPERTDFIFYRRGCAKHLLVTSSEVTLAKVAPDFTNQIQAYSDHYGVRTNFCLIDADSATIITPSQDAIIQEIRSALEDGIKKANSLRIDYSWRTGMAGLFFLFAFLLGKKDRVTRGQFLKFSYYILLFVFFATTGMGLGLIDYETEELSQFRKVLNLID